jgi:Predicted membrane protein
MWLIFALLSAVTASLVAIFGKIGLKGIDSNTATAVRSIVMAVFLVGVVAVQGKLKSNFVHIC